MLLIWMSSYPINLFSRLGFSLENLRVSGVVYVFSSLYIYIYSSLTQRLLNNCRNEILGKGYYKIEGLSFIEEENSDHRDREKEKVKIYQAQLRAITVDQALSSEVRVVLATPAPTPTLTADSREGIIEQPRSSKTSAQVGSFKKVDDDEALFDNISKGLFFQD